MNLLDLFVKIGVEDNASDNLSVIGEKLGNGLKTAAKIGVAAVSAAATGIAALTKASVENFAEYEQLVGGVETLFGTAGQSLQEYAQAAGASVADIRDEYYALAEAEEYVKESAVQAYATAGLSMNEYMETVSSFAASLKQSVGSELEAAAAADQAVIDMADNANKMGTSMEAIQNAYNGFAKQNYTMLDNLKLGYGGTEKEMAHLLADATEISGIEYDMSNLADVYSAIHVIQTELGITGTTAKEASSTISGSASAMKSAWSNLLTALASDDLPTDAYITAFADSVDTFAENIIPRVEVAIGGVVDLVDGLAPMVIERIPGLIDTVLPSLLSAATGMVDSVVAIFPGLLDTVLSAVTGAAPDIVMTVITLIGVVVGTLIDSTPQILDALYLLIDTAVGAVLDSSGSFFDTAMELVTALADGFAEYAPKLLEAGVELIIRLAEELTDPESVVYLVETAISLIQTLADSIIDNLPTLIEKAPEIMENLMNALVAATPVLLQAGVDIIMTLVDAIATNLPVLLTSGADMIFKILEGLTGVIGELFLKGADIVEEIKSGFMDKVEDAKTWGKDLIDNFIGGITSGWESLKSTVTGVAQSIADRLGFSEPKIGPLSNFHTYAPDMMELFAKGVRDNEHLVTDQIERSFDFGAKTVDFAHSAAGKTGSALINSSLAAQWTSAGVYLIQLTLDGVTLATAMFDPLKGVIQQKGEALA